MIITCRISALRIGAGVAAALLVAAYSHPAMSMATVLSARMQEVVESPGKPVAVKPAVPAAAASATGGTMQTQDARSVSQLLVDALAALKKGHLIAPSDSNLFADYEAVLQIDPGNRIASTALREMFPYGALAVKRAVKQGRYDQAQAGIELLAKTDPGNYTLTILRSRLHAARPPASARRSRHGHSMTFTATTGSWISVSYVNGTQLYSGRLPSGQQKRFSVTQPLKVVVGNAPGVTVAVDGKPLSLKPNHQKVARFRVSPN